MSLVLFYYIYVLYRNNTFFGNITYLYRTYMYSILCTCVSWCVLCCHIPCSGISVFRMTKGKTIPLHKAILEMRSVLYAFAFGKWCKFSEHFKIRLLEHPLLFTYSKSFKHTEYKFSITMHIVSTVSWIYQ